MDDVTERIHRIHRTLLGFSAAAGLFRAQLQTVELIRNHLSGFGHLGHHSQVDAVSVHRGEQVADRADLDDLPVDGLRFGDPDLRLLTAARGDARCVEDAGIRLSLHAFNQIVRSAGRQHPGPMTIRAGDGRDANRDGVQRRVGQFHKFNLDADDGRARVDWRIGLGWPLSTRHRKQRRSNQSNGRQTRNLRLGLLTLNYGHNNEIYGSMVVYLRMKNLVPPASEPRPQQQQKK